MQETRNTRQVAIVEGSITPPRTATHHAGSILGEVKSFCVVFCAAGFSLSLVIAIVAGLIGAWGTYTEVFTLALKFGVPAAAIIAILWTLGKAVLHAVREMNDLKGSWDERKRLNETANADNELKYAAAAEMRARAKQLYFSLPVDERGNVLYHDPNSGRLAPFTLNYLQYPSLTTYNHKVESIQEQLSSGAKPALSPPVQIPDPIDFAEILKTFTPSDQGIYIATSIREPIITPMYDLTHVGMGGRTGGGKTNTTRLLMGQLLYAGASVYMATPSIAQVKYNGYRLEDWRPIIARLKEPPAREPEQIKNLLERFLALFEHRKQQEDRSPRRQKDIFLILGELPGITARLKKINYDGVEIIELLLREARQYGVHVVTEFQDILVKTTGLDSGVRENLLTGIYYGGDPRTAKVLLHLEQGEKIEESGLGKHGASYVKIKAVKAQPARVPFFSNRALYHLLGEPPDPMPDREIYDENEIPEFYYRVVNGRYVDACSNIEIEPTEDDFGARPSHRKTGPLTGNDPSLETRSENEVTPLVDSLDATTEERPDYPMMDEIQSAQFIAGYRIKRNIEFNLRQLGLGSGYRPHARELIKQEG